MSAVAKWLLSKAKAELFELRKSHRQTLYLVTEYHWRNSGKDGWMAGIWYQEGRCRQQAIDERIELRALRAVIQELRGQIRNRKRWTMAGKRPISE